MLIQLVTCKWPACIHAGITQDCFKLSWLNTVLQAAGGNSRDRACFKLDKQTWRPKCFLRLFVFKRLHRTTKWISENNTNRLTAFMLCLCLKELEWNQLILVFTVWTVLYQAATIAWSAWAIVTRRRTVKILLLSCRLLSFSYQCWIQQPLTVAKLKKSVRKLPHPSRELPFFLSRAATAAKRKAQTEVTTAIHERNWQRKHPYIRWTTHTSPKKSGNAK